MKKQNNSLTIQKNTIQAENSPAKRLSAMLPGCLLIAGFWGMLVAELQIPATKLGLMIPAIIVLAASLLLCWDKKWQVWTVIGALVVTCISCVLLKDMLASSLAHFLELLGNWWFLCTGRYVPGFESAGNAALILGILSAISGAVTAVILRMRIPLAQILLSVCLLLGWVAGLLSGGWWLALYLLGTLLTVAAYASGQGKALVFSGAIVLMLSVVIGGSVLLTGASLGETALGVDIQKSWHRIRWEENHNPLPEGVLEDLGAYTPSSEATLEVTMQQWTPLYLRGFVAGHYTQSGWEPLEITELSKNAEELYALQETCFFSGTQIYTAGQTAGETVENTVVVRNVGACGAYTYLPYGAGAVTGDVLTSEELRWEGTYAPQDEQYSVQLYDIQNSYLLQAALKNMNDDPYRIAESAYRDWVYAMYLPIPQETRDVLGEYFAVEGEMTTVQAKREIAELLAEMVTYDEKVLTSTGQKDFVSYVLEVSKSGYSVHYATLATLMLRYCGIPARYVEGYLITPSQAEALSSGESLTLTQANAHAWAEYYLDGVGWLPFDAMPEYADILTFALPDDGIPTQEGGSGIQKQKQEQQDDPAEDPLVEEEEEKNSLRIFVREAVSVLLLLLLVLLLGAAARIFLLRARLRKQHERFADPDTRKACAGILCYLQDMTKGIVGKLDVQSVPEMAKEISVTLDGQVEAAELEHLFNEVWYSAHAIPAADVQRATEWLGAAKRIWKQKVPMLKRFHQRFISCKIL